MNIRKIIVSLIVIIVLGFLTKTIGSKLSSSQEKAKPKVTVVKPSLVQKLKINNRSIIPKFETEGKLTSSEVISVSVEGKGTLKSSIVLKEGSTFYKGQRIAYVLDNQATANFKASLFKYHQTLTNALIDIKIEYPSEHLKWETFTSNIQKGTLNKLPEVSDSKLNNYLSAKGVYNSYYDLQSIKTSLTKRTFTAPFSGYVSKVSVQSGSFINGTTKICEISPKDKLELRFSLNDEFASNIKKGTIVNITSSKGKVFKGRVNRIGSQINDITQQRDFTAEIIDKSNNVIAGDFVKIEIPLSSKASMATVLPSYCINDDKLFLIAENSELMEKSISVIGIRNDSLIVTGLQNNDILLLESFNNFKSGQKVRYN